MKRLFLIAGAIFFALTVQAQSVEEGVKYLRYERYETAKKTLEPLATNNPEANYYLGIAELGLENVAAAKAIFSKDLNNFYNQAGMARVLFLEGKQEEANSYLQKIVDKAKKKDWERYKVAADAITYTKGGNVQDAIDWYKKAIDRNKDADLLVSLGDAYLKLQSGGGEAMNNFEKAVELDPKNSLAYSRIGSVWYDARNYDLALKNYNLAKETDSNNPLPYRDLAQAYRAAGRYDNSLKHIEEYLAKSDKSVNNQITYANALYLAEKYPEALEKMEQLLKQGIEKPYMYRIIAYTAYETGDVEKAEKNLRRFFEKETNKENYINSDYKYAGKIYLAKAEADPEQKAQYIDRAERYFDELLRAQDESDDQTELMREIGDSFKDAKEYKKASNWYGKIIEKNENASPLDYFYWGFYNFYAEDYTTAAKSFDKMIEMYPDEGSGYFWRARVAAAKDSEAKTGEAVPYFKKWIEFKDEEGKYEHQTNDLILAYQYLAYYYYNQKDKAQAMSWVNKILEKKPGDEWAMSIKNYFDALK